MPTYDFRCPAGHDTERFFRTISGAPSEIACPQCGETAARQVSGGAGLMFKGSGFYLTDYGKNAHRKGGSSGAGSSGSGESKSSESKSSESKGGESKSGESGGSKSPDGGAAKPAPKSDS